MRRRRVGGCPWVAVAAVLLAATACSEGTTGPGAQATSPTSTASIDVVVADSDLGEILTDADGFTLYVFLQDSGGVSACIDDCAQTWPPLLADGEPAGSADLGAELGTVARDDGTEQVTVAGSPVYLYSGDQAPGDTEGQGIGDVWYVVSPDGEPVTDGGGARGGYGY